MTDCLPVSAEQADDDNMSAKTYLGLLTGAAS